MCSDLALRPWAPAVLDGWRGAATRSLRQDHGRLDTHALLTVSDGRCEAQLDGRRFALRPGLVLLAQPGQRLAWTHPRDAHAQILLFDCAWRERRRSHRAALTADGPGETLAALWGIAVPALLDGDLGRLAGEAMGAIGDLWWREGGDRLLADARLAALLAQILQHLASVAPDAGPWTTLMAWAERRLEHGVRVEDMAAEAGLERAAFTRAWAQSVGIAPGRWLRNLRLARAQRLLREGDLTQAQVALHCGYRSRAAFEAAFRAACGRRPRAWRLAEASAWRSRSTVGEPPFPRQAETLYRPK